MNKNKGFTLIELMIVVVIVAILASVAFPAYQDSVRKSRRAEAKMFLLEVAQILERCFTDFNAYNNVGCSVVTAGVPPINLVTNPAGSTNILNGSGYYTITSTPVASAYTLSATPNALGNQNQDRQCASFTLSNTGTKDAFNTGAVSTRDICWQ